MILLSTPFSVGDAGGGYSYTHVKAVTRYDEPGAKTLVMQCRHGYLDAGEFVAGVEIAGVTTQEHVLNDTDYDALFEATSAAADEVYIDELTKLADQWLIDEGHYIGTVA